MKINTIAICLIVILISCKKDNEDCKVIYNEKTLIDSFSIDSLNLKYDISQESIYLINDHYCNHYGVVFKYPLLDLKLDKMEYKLVYSPDCVGDKCDSLSRMFAGRGYILVVLDKNPEYVYFKHIVIDTIVNSMSYLDSTQIHSINENPSLPERYFKMGFRKDTSFYYFRNVQGKYQFRFSY
ncbi:MAG: hypothetical protein HC819_22910 [Cyclobacteriaceae bacterium]|nr:hypothetical protein [Cyclobacteriaceae bacterium]